MRSLKGGGQVLLRILLRYEDIGVCLGADWVLKEVEESGLIRLWLYGRYSVLPPIPFPPCPRSLTPYTPYLPSRSVCVCVRVHLFPDRARVVSLQRAETGMTSLFLKLGRFS